MTKQPISTRLRITKGPHKGVAFKLVSGKITIGRASNNNISLDKDEKCSRKQAVITLSPQGDYFIKDLSGKSSLKINDMVKLQSELKDGDLIKFGTTVMQFEMKESATGMMVPVPAQEAPSREAPVPLIHQKQEPASVDSYVALKGGEERGGGYTAQDPYAIPSASQKTPAKKNKIIFRSIVGVLVLMGAWLFLSGEDKKEGDKLSTLMDREENIKTLAELKEKELEKRSKNQEVSFKNAQAAYISGIRDYRKGVYGRAIESFRVCKTLYPQHELCESYLKNTQVKYQQLIQAWMVAGKDYREKRRFISCMSAFKNVIMAINDKYNVTHKEAQENFDICQIQHKDRY